MIVVLIIDGKMQEKQIIVLGRDIVKHNTKCSYRPIGRVACFRSKMFLVQIQIGVQKHLFFLNVFIKLTEYIKNKYHNNQKWPHRPVG